VIGKRVAAAVALQEDMSLTGVSDVVTDWRARIVEIVEYWLEAITGELYLKAMEAGEVFFIAVGEASGSRAVLGFANDYCIEGQKHGTSVYVRGRSARRGVGSALLARAEAHAVSNGATSIEIEASLAGVAFYTANGFVEVGRGETARWKT
jgi:GNAT superfamily N-acetyltransferase